MTNQQQYIRALETALRALGVRPEGLQVYSDGDLTRETLSRLEEIRGQWPNRARPEAGAPLSASTRQQIERYVRAAVARATILNHAINGLPYGPVGLATALGRSPTGDELFFAEATTLGEVARRQWFARVADDLGIAISFDEHGRFFFCDSDGVEIQIGRAYPPGLVWPMPRSLG